MRLGSWLPFERAREEAEALLGVRLTDSTIRRQTLAAGRALVAAETKAAEWVLAEVPEPSGEGVAHQQVSVDGVMVPLVGEWAEVKTLAIGTVVPGPQGEPRARQLSYFSRLCDHTAFGRLATVETHRRATQRAGRVTAVADGAEWIQEFFSLQCPQATRIIDWGHASSYVHAAGRALFGDGGQAASWCQQHLGELRHGAPQRVINDLCRHLADLEPASATAETVATSLGYLARRQEQIAYACFSAQGLPIGSGIVESANKLVVQARLKGSGMRWVRGNVDAMLALRGAICSEGRWSATWSSLRRYRAQRAREQAQTVRRARHAPPPRFRPPRIVAGRPTHDHPWRRFRLPGSPPPAKL